MTEDARLDPLLGRTVADGRYQVLALLGVGGMGTVYRALQHPLERQVALKLIHRELAMNEHIVARFEREMRMTASIEHPHTVRVYDFGQIEGQPFLAMEYLAGKSLRAILETGALPSERLAVIGLQIAKALRAAHQAGIVHRDLKPDNVLLVDGYGERDFVKVLDFGIARPLEPEPGFQTSAGAIIGTPAYMSPEQVNGAPVDARSDLYALGVILFELATGAPPFAGPMTVLLMAHAQQLPPSLEGFDSIPIGIRTLIARLLEKDPAARPASAEQVIELLAPFATGETTTQGTAPQRTAILSGAEQGRSPASAPRAGGTMMLPDAQRPRDSGPTNPHPPAPPPGAAPGKWVMILVGLVVIAGAGALGYRQRRAAQHHDTRPTEVEAGVAKKPPSGETSDQPVNPQVAPEVARQRAAALQAPGEPPWPAACRDAERWVIEARNSLPTDPTAAAQAGEKAVALCPVSPVAYNLLGNALQRLQKLDGAEQQYQAALSLAPAFLAPRFNVGLLRLRRDDAKGALAAFEAVARTDAGYPNLPLVRADAHRRLGDAAAARADLQDQVSRHPEVAEGWLQLGRARAAAHDKRGARDAFCHAKSLGDTTAAGLCRR